jgi:hypothetical protein
MTLKYLLGVAAVALGILAFAAAAAGGSSALATARAGTAGYHNINAALGDGYGLFTDAAGIACIDKAGAGAMGIHYVKGALVGDPAESAATPEALVYEPQPNGRLRLVAVEYVVLQSAWDAGHASPPSLFGEQFALIPAGNRYGLPPFYELHAWIWKHNPRDMFDDWNPNVTCNAA